jgi:hypothetical protein
MRFYLSTFIQVVMLCGALMAVVMRWEPWVAAESYSSTKLRQRLTSRLDHSKSYQSPDGTRYLDKKHSGWEIIIFDNKNAVELCRIDTEQFHSEFLTDDVFLNVDPFNDENNRIYRRRHPEWWWGHFYRPEVWASIALFFSLVIHLVRARNQRNAGH